MSVTDFECAIAKSQIGRYIAGDNLAPEVARQLENHIDNCPRCKQLLQEKKNSLEAMIGSTMDSEERTILTVTNQPVPMTKPTATDGSSALKPDFMEVLADSARQSLREKLKESARTKTKEVEVPAVAPAFAYKDAIQNETVKLKLETSAEPKKKSNFLSAFALYKNVPDEETKPSLSVENIRSAKAVFRDNNQTMKKPMMYLAGLCCVVAAMSFVLRDPTTLFGGKAAVKTATTATLGQTSTPTTKKPSSRVAKILPHKPTQLNVRGTDSQVFTDAPAPKPIKLSPTMLKKIQAAKRVTPKLAHRTSPQHGIKRTSAQHFAIKSKTVVHHHKSQKSTAKVNEVKLYTTDPTPITKTNTSGEQN